MDVTRLSRLIDFDSVRASWQELAAGRPMQGWHWNSTWWMHYGQPDTGPQRELMTLVVKDGSHVVAIAPWFLDQTSTRGRVIRFLGEDEICTEYPSILCHPADRARVTSALADYLVNEAPTWDVLELAGIEEDNALVNDLVAHLAEQGFSKFDRRGTFRCWKLSLPSSWDEYLQTLSKSHRMQLRRLQKRVLDAGRASVYRLTEAAHFDEAWNVLVDLHQRRRQSLGEPGCFASQRFASFHRSVARHLLDNGQLGLVWLELAGRPISVEYNLIGSDTTYSYQGGVDPEFLEEQPGRLSTMQTIQWAIEGGQSTFDFLRGDEPYKAHWRAEPVECYTVRVVAERTTAQLREAAYQAAGSIKDWVKTGWQRVRETALREVARHADAPGATAP